MATRRIAHFVAGIQGLAVLRSWLAGDRTRADARFAEMAAVVARPAGGPLGIELPVDECDVGAGYARWAATYDATPNPLIRAEEAVVHALVAALPVGRALDAACGTGRHTAYLASRGHRVIAVDGSRDMLAVAAARVPGAELCVGDLAALPVDDASVDVAVCALALTHCPTLDPAIAELARVLRPGGRLILSDLHPMQMATGGTAFFVGGDGRAGAVRSYLHLHADYVAAFQAAGLTIERCLEPLPDRATIELAAGGFYGVAPAAFDDALTGLPTALVWQLMRAS